MAALIVLGQVYDEAVTNRRQAAPLLLPVVTHAIAGHYQVAMRTRAAELPTLGQHGFGYYF
ncbi:MAG: hypothetical protein ACKOWD_16930 [Rhodoferax sp.]